MKNLVRIDSSALSQNSNSKSLADVFCQNWQTLNPDGEITQIDLAQENLPHLSEATIFAMYTDAQERSEAQQAALAKSDAFIAQLKTADDLLISAPMYNFSIPSTLKAYIDLIARVGETFVYTEQGPKGLLENKTAYIIASSGGDYTQAPLDQMNFVVPYLKTVLGFIGIQDVHVIQAPGMAQTQPQIDATLAQCTSEIEGLLKAS